MDSEAKCGWFANGGLVVAPARSLSCILAYPILPYLHIAGFYFPAGFIVVFSQRKSSSSGSPPSSAARVLLDSRDISYIDTGLVNTHPHRQLNYHILI